MTDVERLLRSALVPVEPSEALSDRLERHLSELTDAAVTELAEWDPAAMRDPRNWARPAAAVVIGGAAGAGLVILRARHRAAQRRPATGTRVAEAAERALREVFHEARRIGR
jgi:hypothetical protein